MGIVIARAAMFGIQNAQSLGYELNRVLTTAISERLLDAFTELKRLGIGHRLVYQPEYSFWTLVLRKKNLSASILLEIRYVDRAAALKQAADPPGEIAPAIDALLSLESFLFD